MIGGFELSAQRYVMADEPRYLSGLVRVIRDGDEIAAIRQWFDGAVDRSEVSYESLVFSLAHRAGVAIFDGDRIGEGWERVEVELERGSLAQVIWSLASPKDRLFVPNLQVSVGTPVDSEACEFMDGLESINVQMTHPQFATGLDAEWMGLAASALVRHAGAVRADAAKLTCRFGREWFVGPLYGARGPGELPVVAGTALAPVFFVPASLVAELGGFAAMTSEAPVHAVLPVGDPDGSGGVIVQIATSHAELEEAVPPTEAYFDRIRPHPFG